MTPPTAAANATETTAALTPRDAADHVVAPAPLARLLEPRGWWRVRLAVDAIVLYLASSVTLLVTGGTVAPANQVIAAVFPLIALVTLRTPRSADERMGSSLLDAVIRVAIAVSLAAMLSIALATIIGAPHPVALSARLWLVATVLVAVARVLLLFVRRRALHSGAFATPTLIVGAGSVGQHLAMRLTGDPRYGLRPVGFLDADPLEGDELEDTLVPVLGEPNDLADSIRRTGARHVIFAFASESDRLLVERVRDCEQLGVTVSLVPRLFESINDRATLDHVGGLPLVAVRPTDPRGWQFAVKHAFDRSFAFLALLATAPLMIAIALAVRLSSPGPMLFRQRRVGRDGREFDVLKFRTMRTASGDRSEFLLPEGVAPGGIEGQDRRTPIGRFLRDSSLDELPQFINVLRGDMSIVGPRPERPAYVKRFRRDIARYEDRHRVRSGITGWAQVNGLRGRTSIADRVEWDNYYIRNWSLALDLRIIVLTLVEVFRLRGG